MALQQFGVIPFQIKTLKIGHTEQKRTQRFYIAEIVSTEAPLVRGGTEDTPNRSLEPKLIVVYRNLV